MDTEFVVDVVPPEVFVLTYLIFYYSNKKVNVILSLLIF
jgi:hypothetical protein